MRVSQRIWRNRALGAAACFTLALSAATAGFAQEIPPAARADLDKAFQAVVTDPSNLDLTYIYAQMATKFGDYEAAITSYERLLLFNPDLPRVKAELGVLYYRLGSFETAKSYLLEALEVEDLPDAARKRISSFLSKIEDTSTPHSFSGSFAFGGRNQTNANSGPNGNVLVNNAVATPGDDTVPNVDSNLFASLRGSYVYDMGNDAGEYISIEGAIYTARQFKLTELDVEHFHLNAGPSFKMFPKDSGPVSFRPSVRLTHARLNDEGYNFSAGMGADIDWNILDDTSLFSRAFYEHREYYATKERGNADTQDGQAWKFSAGATHKIDQKTFVRGEAFAGEVSAVAASEAYSEAGVVLSVGKRFESPLKDVENLDIFVAPWTLSANARYTNRKHDAPNLIVANTTREDDVYRLGVTWAVPLGDGWSVFSTLSYQDNQSNIPNNDFENVGATLGANVRF